jgi:uncharacterized RDD family membrane protein YckC
VWEPREPQASKCVLAGTPIITEISSQTHYPTASIIRRCAAMLYDFLLILAVWAVTTAVLVNIVGHGQSINGLWFQTVLYLEWMGFYVFFWRIKGQSLGMQVWKIRALTFDGELMSLARCIARFLGATMSFACLAIGFIWMLFDARQLTWYDRMTSSQVIYLGDKPYASERIRAGSRSSVETSDDSAGAQVNSAANSTAPDQEVGAGEIAQADRHEDGDERLDAKDD